jgi:hypothetical protein
MKYLGIMKQEHGHVTMPDIFHTIELQQNYEVVEASGDLLLLPSPLDRSRLSKIERLTKQSIKDHRQTLEGLAR